MPLVAAWGAGVEEEEGADVAVVMGPVYSATWGWERMVRYQRVTFARALSASTPEACMQLVLQANSVKGLEISDLSRSTGNATNT